MMSTKTEIFVLTSDVASLVSLFNIAGGYDSESNLHFNKNEFGLQFSTKDELAMIEFRSSKSQLLNYHYDIDREDTYIGVNLKECYSLLKSIPSKKYGQIYKMENDNNLYINYEGSQSKEGATQLDTIVLPVDDKEPPDFDNNFNCIKVSTSDFSDICASFTKIKNCTHIRFTIKGCSLFIKSYKATGENPSSHVFRNSNPNMEDDEDDIITNDNCGPTISRKGKFKVIVEKKSSSDQFSIETTIDKLKPLTKLGALCKNGIVYFHACKSTSEKDKVLAIKVNTGQSGILSVYLRDSSEYYKINY